jgi:hypothetical protein
MGFFVLVLGCGGGAKPMLPVTGKVTYLGMALHGGTLVFTPDTSRGADGPIALGDIRADGTYTLRTGKAYGAAPGWYRVTVAAVSSQTEMSPGQPYRIPLSLIPEKYRDPELSQLICEVKADKLNSFNFNLE